MVVIRDATFPSEPITGTAPHHQITNNYRRLPAHNGSLPANYRHLYVFQHKGCLPLPEIYRQRWSFYHKVPPVIKNYRHAGNVIMKSCTSCYVTIIAFCEHNSDVKATVAPSTFQLATIGGHRAGWLLCWHQEVREIQTCKEFAAKYEAFMID